MKANELMAEALVEQRYCYRWYGDEWFPKMLVIKDNDDGDRGEALQYSSDTIEGYRQLFALADWLRFNHFHKWSISVSCQPEIVTPDTEYNWLCVRVKWCFEQLAGEQ